MRRKGGRSEEERREEWGGVRGEGERVVLRLSAQRSMGR